ncbi:MAG: phosphotransferase family protein, partial [Pseudomonadota bacterium]
MPAAEHERNVDALDIPRLGGYLADRIDSFGTLRTAEKFSGGQSNPTFLLETDDARYVLRRKPPGILLRSAHAVDREFRVLTALAGSDVPVARPLHLCEDPGVIGSAFYVMDFVDGRTFWRPDLPEVSS